MGAFAENVKNGWLDDLTSGTLYLALFVGDPSDGGTEVSGSNYARKEVTDSDWNNAVSGQITNKTELSFVKSADVWSSSNVTHFALYDAATGGNLQAYDDFPANQQQPIMAENIVQFAPGNIQLRITDTEA